MPCNTSGDNTSSVLAILLLNCAAGGADDVTGDKVTAIYISQCQLHWAQVVLTCKRDIGLGGGSRLRIGVTRVIWPQGDACPRWVLPVEIFPWQHAKPGG